MITDYRTLQANKKKDKRELEKKNKPIYRMKVDGQKWSIDRAYQRKKKTCKDRKLRKKKIYPIKSYQNSAQ